MNVIDASIGFKWEITEEGSDKALRLRDDFSAGTRDLIAPDFFPIELGNAFLIAERRKRTSDASALYADLMLMLPLLHSSLALFPRAFEIAKQSRATVYDSLYIALAEREGCQVITADQRLVALFPTLAVTLDSI